MPDNKYYNTEDFLMDDSFIEWAIGNYSSDAVYWKNFLLLHPESEENFKQALSIAKSVEIKPSPGLSSNEISVMVSSIMHKTSTDSLLTTALKNSPIIHKSYRIAAVLIVTLSVGFCLQYVLRFSGQRFEHNAHLSALKYLNNNGKLPMLVKLPDKSSVILQPGAELTYGTGFNGSKREVRLNGEAFFEIHKNTAKPFFVYSNELIVKVTGTSFKVVAKDSDDQYKVSVSTGRVEVSATAKSGHGRQPIILMPNQEVVLFRKELRLHKESLKKPMLLSKVSAAKHFNFSGAPFSEVIETIDQAYGVHISYDEKIMANCQLTASLIDQTLDERLMLICKAVEADYKIENGQIIITGKGCNN